MSTTNDAASPDGDNPLESAKTSAENVAAIPVGDAIGELILTSAEGGLNTSATGILSEDNVNDKLIQAILKRDLQLVKDAISAGADLNFMIQNPKDYLTYPEYYLTNPEDYLTNDNFIVGIGRTPLGIAVMSKNITVVQELIWAGADVNVLVPSVEGGTDTALEMAITAGQTEVVKLLLENSANVTGFTPLHDALIRSHFDIVRLLINYVPDVDIRDLERRTPLQHAARHGDECIDIVRELISRHANVNSQDRDDFTPLHDAAFSGYESGGVLALLLENGAEIDMKDNSGQIPLHVAAERMQTASIKILVQYGADINARDSRGRTPIHLATKSAEKEIFMMKNDDILETIKVLIECGADIGLADENGLTALHFLSLMDVSNVESLQLLVVDEHALNAQDSCGRTALHNSVCLGFHRVVNVFLSSENIKVNVRDISGCIPLHYAIPVGNEETIRCLLAAGSNINALDSSGKSVLHVSAIYGHCDLIGFFIEEGLDPNSTDNAGRNSLNYAVMYRQDEAVKALLAKNADHEKRDLNGLVPKNYLHRCEKMSLTYRILCGEPVNMPVFTLSDEKRFVVPIAHQTPNLVDVSSIAGVGDVGNIEQFDFNNFVCQIRKSIREIICKALPELREILEPDSTKCTNAFKPTEQMMSNRYLHQQVLLEVKKQMKIEGYMAKLIGCGSSSERSKVGIPDELDFLINMFHLGFLADRKQDGYANMLSQVEYKFLNVEHTYSVWLWTRLMAYWSENNKSSTMSTEKEQFHMPLPPTRFPDRTTCVTWVWMYSDSNFKMLPVSIDLVPALFGSMSFMNTGYKAKSTWLMSQEDVRHAGAYLVPKMPHLDSKVSKQFSLQDQKELGRISFPHLEVMHMANLDKRVKNVYVTAKCLRKPEICGFKVRNKKGEILPVGDYVTSYRLKTVFLHLVQMFLQTTFSLGRMVLFVYEQLEACLERDFLPVFFNQEMNVLAGSKLRTEDSLRVARVMTEFVRSLYMRDFQMDLESDSLEQTKSKAMMPSFQPKSVATDDAK